MKTKDFVFLLEQHRTYNYVGQDGFHDTGDGYIIDEENSYMKSWMQYLWRWNNVDIDDSHAYLHHSFYEY